MQENKGLIIGVLVTVVLGGLIIASASTLAKDWRVTYAEQLGINVEQFQQDLENADVIARVDADMQESIKRGVNSTPSIFINGEKIEFIAEFATELEAKIIEVKADPETETILIEEFSDFQCPACKLFFESTKEIKEKYSEDENFTWVFIHIPLESIHHFAYDAAVAAEAAREQGKFDEMHDLFFKYQDTIKNPKFE